MANRQCNLECVKDEGIEGEVIEFVGPVKIILVDPPKNVYRRRVWGASFVVLGQMMMAATTMTLLFYALGYKTKFYVALHVFVCTVGYQLCVPCGILSLNKQGGSSAPMRIPDRQSEHVLLEFFAIILAVGATVLLFTSGVIFEHLTVHSFTGLVTGFFAVLAVLTGIPLYAYFGTPEVKERFQNFSRYISVAHTVLGSATFIFSSICFMLGIYRPAFQMWVPEHQMLGILIIFCLLYTAVTLYRPIIEMMGKAF